MDTGKWIHKGPQIPLPEMKKPLGHFLWERLQQLEARKVLQIDDDTDEKMHTDELLTRAVAVAKQLNERGFKEGDIVSAALDNTLDVAPVLFGTLFAGLTYAPFNPDLHEDDLRHMVNLLKPRLVLCVPRSVETIRSALPAGAEAVEVRTGGEWHHILKAPANTSEVANFQPAEDLDLNGAAAIMCSSGTTGSPKGVMLPHRVWHDVLQLTMKILSKLPPEAISNDVNLVATPNFWISGLSSIITSAYRGGQVVLLPGRVHAARVLAAIQRRRVTNLTAPPPLVAGIARLPGAETFDCSSVRHFGYGGAPLPPALATTVARRLSLRAPLSHYYAQTECILVSLPGLLSPKKPGTIGCIAPNVQVKVINIETGKTVGPNTEGELCFKSTMTFSGYYNNPKATVNTIDPEGWLHSGDVGYFDEDGYFFVCDRYKELIKYKGIHIAPSDVEKVLMSHESVQTAAVVGVEHNEDQEHPVGFVVLQEGCKASKEELIELVKQQLPVYKQLHGGLHFIKEIPHTATGKVMRRELRQLARTLQEEK